MAPKHPNQDIERPTSDSRRKPGIEEIPDRTHAEPGDAADRADDVGMDVDEPAASGDQDLDTAAIVDVDPESANSPVKQSDRPTARKAQAKPRKSQDRSRASDTTANKPDGGRSTPTGRSDVDHGKHKTPGAQPGHAELQNALDGGRTQPVRSSGETITPPHADVIEVADEDNLDDAPEGSAHHKHGVRG